MEIYSLIVLQYVIIIPPFSSPDFLYTWFFILYSVFDFTFFTYFILIRFQFPFTQHTFHLSYTPIGLSSIIVCLCSPLILDLHSRQMLNFLYTCLYWLSSRIVFTMRKCL